VLALLSVNLINAQKNPGNGIDGEFYSVLNGDPPARVSGFAKNLSKTPGPLRFASPQVLIL